MRIPSGKTDIGIYFLAVDATDLRTRKTGLSGFTVYRSRNGGAATAYTTPTITEVSAANCPGTYFLLIDEDTTLSAGSDSEEYVVHITVATMAPVTRTIELYRREVTTGNTLSVSAAGRALSDLDTIKTQTVTCSGGVTVPAATLASTTNITSATGIVLNNGAQTITNLTCTAGITVTQSNANTPGLSITGNGTGEGILATSGSGATGHGIRAVSAATNGSGITGVKTGTGFDLNCTTTPLTLAKTTNITGFNDIAATAIVSAGAITTSGGRALCDVDTIKTQAVTASGGITFPAATLASTTNITSASGITLNNGAHTITSLTCTAGVIVTQSSANASGVSITGNGTGHGVLITSGSGVTGDGLRAVAASTNGNGITGVKTGTGSDFNCTSTPLTLAKTTNITGFNDIAATAIVSSGAITTSGGAVSTVTNVTTVNGLAANTITAASIAASAITSAKLATDAIDSNALAATAVTEIVNGVWNEARSSHTTVGSFGEGVASVQGNVTGSVGSVTAGVTVTTNNDKTGYRLSATGVDDVWDEPISGHLTAGSTGNALNSAGSAGDPWSTPLPGAYGAGTAGKIIGDNINATISSRSTLTGAGAAAAVWDETRAGHTTAGTFGQGIASVQGNVTGSVDSVTTGVTVTTNNDKTGYRLSATGVGDVWDEATAGHTTAGTTGKALIDGVASGSDPWSTTLPGAYGAGTAGNILGNNLNATITSRASQASLDVVDSLIDTEINDILTKTNQLTFTVANRLDVNIRNVNGVPVTGTGAPGDEWGP